MKDAVADASEHPKESGARLASKLDAGMTNRRDARMRNSIRSGSPVSPRLPSNEPRENGTRRLRPRSLRRR